MVAVYCGLLETLVVLGVLHGALGHAMRARGHPRWRVHDTALVSPLLWVGLLLFFASFNHGMLRGGVLPIAAAVAGLVMTWFGGRAVGKLY
jgi:4-amino-4-deoxy-L-arabinose transferase-like glycosyltransferase